MRRGQNRTTKTTLWSERSSALKKGLTGPTLLEMSDYPTYRDLCIYLDPNFTPLLVYAQFFLSFSLGIVVSMWANLL